MIIGNVETMKVAAVAPPSHSAEPTIGEWFQGRVVGLLSSPTSGIETGVTYIPPAAEPQWHTHDSTHVMIVLEGKGVVESAGGISQIHRGDIVQIDRALRHQMRASDEEGLTLIWFRS